MKELSIQEKAKRYDEALKILHKYDGENIIFSQSLKEEMFPELKESDDEKVRKEILEYFSQFENGELRGVDITPWIAWLEKKSENGVNGDDMEITNTWRPSKEQIEVLEHSLGDYNIKIFEDRYEILKSLYNDLKKLEGE